MAYLNYLRKTWKIIPSEYKVRAIKSFCLSAVNAVLDIISLAALLPLLILLANRQTFDWLPKNLSFENTLFIISCSVILLFILKNFISIAIARYQHTFTTSLSCDLSEQVYLNFFNKPYLEVVKENSADTWRKISTTPSDFANQVMLGFLTLSLELLILLALSLLILFYNPVVLGILIAVFTPVVVGYYLFKKKLLYEVEQSFRNIAPLAGVQLQKGIDSFMEVKIYHNEEYFKNNFIDLKREAAANLSELKTATVVPSKVFEIAGVLILSVSFIYYALTHTDAGELIISLGVLTATFYRLAPSFNKILINITQIKAYAYSLDELTKLLAFHAHSSNVSQDTLAFSSRIQLNKIEFQYSGSPFLLKGIHPITINKGTFTLIVGKSGNGKTTLLNMLAGLLPIETSNLIVDDTKLTSLNLKAWQNNIGYVPQHITILNDTLLNNILVGSDLNEQHLQEVIHLACLESLVQSMPFGLQTKIGEMGSTISGGQAQRIILARALYRQPSVLLLDEFVNQLDPDTKQMILANLQKLVNQSLTIIAASHDAMLELFADQFIQIDKGEIRIISSEIVTVLPPLK